MSNDPLSNSPGTQGQHGATADLTPVAPTQISGPHIDSRAHPEFHSDWQKVTPSLPMQKLSEDKLLQAAARIQFQNQTVPSLGGIALVAKIGQGGMGAVYLGIHPRLRQEVAVKVLPFPLLAHQPDLIKRFFREAELAAMIKSPHLVAVSDVNEEHGLVFLVMEYVHGLSAGSYLRHSSQIGHVGLPEPSALDICIAACEGLAAAHMEGVIHRDIKPDNIIIPKARRIDEVMLKSAKLADLGLARTDELGGSMTGSQAALGTPGYMAPEQAIDAKKVRKSADVFSMGATLYALLAGRAPFVGETPMNTILATIQQPFPAMNTLRSDVTQATCEMLDKCLKKDPTERYVDGSALLQAMKVCRAAIGEPHATQIRAVEQVTLLQKSGEIGAAARMPTPTPQQPGRDASSSVIGGANAPAPVLTPQITIVGGPASPQTMMVAAPKTRSRMPVVLAVCAVLMAAAGIGYWQWTGLVFRGEMQTALDQSRPALTQDGVELDGAIARLDGFLAKYPTRGDDEKQPALELEKSLADRRTELMARKNSFEGLLNDARELLADKPLKAYEKACAAETLGAEDAAKAYPSLITTKVVDLEKRAVALANTQADTAGEKASRAAGAELDAAIEQLEASRKALGKQLAETDAINTRLAALTARREELKARNDSFQQSLATAEAAEPLAALKSLEEARKAATADETKGYPALLPENGPSLQERIDALHTALLQKFSIAAKQDPEGQRENLQAALKVWGESADREKLLALIGGADYAAAMKDGHVLLEKKEWAGARAAFERALKSKPDDETARQGIADTDGGAFAQEQQALLDACRPALKQHGAELTTATQRLKEFTQKNATRGEALHDASDLLSKLEGRAAQLTQRAIDFNSNVRAAEALAATDPVKALAQLIATQAMGGANDAEGLPSLEPLEAPAMQERIEKMRETVKPLFEAQMSTAETDAAAGGAEKLNSAVSHLTSATEMVANLGAEQKDRVKRLSDKLKDEVAAHNILVGAQNAFNQQKYGEARQALEKDLLGNSQYKATSSIPAASALLAKVGLLEEAAKFTRAFAMYNAATNATINYEIRWLYPADLPPSEWISQSLNDNKSQIHSIRGATGAEIRFQNQVYTAKSVAVAADHKPDEKDVKDAKQHVESNDNGRSFAFASGDGNGHKVSKTLGGIGIGVGGRTKFNY